MDYLQEFWHDPSQTVDHAGQLLAERGLRHFVRYMWSEIEPAVDYVEAKSTAAICEHLEAVTGGQIKKLVINVPPGTMKSMLVNICWPAWEWGPKNLPWHRYICATYGQSLTSNMSLKSRFLLTSEKYRRAWGNRFKFMLDQNNKLQFTNNHWGMRLSTSVEGRLTGERATRIICDDLHNVKKAESDAERAKVVIFFFEALPSRTVDPKQFICIVVMQRVHEADVTGEILARELGYEHLRLPMRYEEDSPCYVSLPFKYMGSDNPPRQCVYDTNKTIWLPADDYEKTRTEADTPAAMLKKKTMYKADWRSEEGELLSPDYFNEESVTRLETDMGGPGSYAVAGQMQQRPISRGGGMFPKEWQVIEEMPDILFTVCGWDLACSTRSDSPYTARVKMCVTKSRQILVQHVTRFRAEPQQVYARLENISRLDGPEAYLDFPQDPGQAAKGQVIQIASLLHGLNFSFSPESGDKESRAVPFASQVHAGNVVLLKGQWNKEFIDELAKFPRSKYKDMVDAASRAYNRLQKLISSESIYDYALDHDSKADLYEIYTE